LDASLKYEYALSVFKHLTNNDEGWKKKGILDQDITQHEYTPVNDEEAVAIKDLFVSVYLNIARTYHKQRDTTTAVQACDSALELDSECDKAMFLRAQIRIAPASAGGVEMEMATKDVAAALRVIKSKLSDLDLASNGGDGDGDGGGDGGGSGGDGAVRLELLKRQKEVMRMLKKLRSDKAEQSVKDKEFAGAFHRGELYRPDEEPTKPAGPMVVHGGEGTTGGGGGGGGGGGDDGFSAPNTAGQGSDDGYGDSGFDISVDATTATPTSKPSTAKRGKTPKTPGAESDGYGSDEFEESYGEDEGEE